LENIVNNLPDAFTDYKGVTKSWNHAVDANERMKVSKKTIQAPSLMKMGRANITKKDNASTKHPRKEKMRHLQKIINNIPLSSTQTRYINENASTLKNPVTLILGNHEESNEIEEISINYTSSREVYDRSTIIVNSSFSVIIAESVIGNPDPNTIVVCKKCSYWNKWKEAIGAGLSSVKKRKVFSDVIPTPPGIFSVGFK
jgi:hypothetical protein